jgi:hypothetical protein
MKCFTYYKGQRRVFFQTIYLLNYHFTHRETTTVGPLGCIVYHKKPHKIRPKSMIQVQICDGLYIW